MPLIQDICRVRICWLEPGDVCLESRLRCTEFAECNTIARFDGRNGAAYKRLNKEACLTAILAPNRRFPFDGVSSAVNPLVEVLEPATLFEFDVADSGDGWLASELVGGRAERIFRSALDEVENIGFYLWRKGRCVPHGRWGVSVSFYTLWVCLKEPGSSLDPESVEFAGYLDLARMPLGLFVEKPGKQHRPEHSPALAGSGT
jgi:hypothetical protein